MSRGLDLDDVTTVINYDIPKHIKTYIHRYYLNTQRSPYMNHFIFQSRSYSTCRSVRPMFHYSAQRGSALLQDHSAQG